MRFYGGKSFSGTFLHNIHCQLNNPPDPQSMTTMYSNISVFANTCKLKGELNKPKYKEITQLNKHLKKKLGHADFENVLGWFPNC